ncbi:MAG: hypothetical protein EXR76_11310, partial [Myxococcales bacterium]|nr:hypothetical protein [Myxococcales bacterium]
MRTSWNFKIILGAAVGLAACESTNVLRQYPAIDAQAPETDGRRVDMAATEDALPTVDRGANPADIGVTDGVVPTADGMGTSDLGTIKDVLVST